MPEQLQGHSLEASLTVRNLEQSARWYADVLGFSEDRRHERAFPVHDFFNAGVCRLGSVQTRRATWSLSYFLPPS